MKRIASAIPFHSATAGINLKSNCFNIMKRSPVFLFLLFLTTMESAWAQNQLIISGGNVVSSILCGNRKVYTWGDNTQGTGTTITGTLGNGSTAAVVTSPLVVNFPITGGIDISQVNAGSGAHLWHLTVILLFGPGVIIPAAR